MFVRLGISFTKEKKNKENLPPTLFNGCHYNDTLKRAFEILIDSPYILPPPISPEDSRVIFSNDFLPQRNTDAYVEKCSIFYLASLFQRFFYLHFYKRRLFSDRHANATDAEKAEQEKKFKEVGEAYGVLSDTKKRTRYDQGHDIEDLDGGGHGGSPFAQDIDPNHIFQAFFGGGGMPGGMPGGGGGQHFGFGGPGGHSSQGFSFQFG